MYYLEQCVNGDVKLATDATPFIFWDNIWSPLCGVYFWNNDHGAKAFCQKLGYNDGTKAKKQRKYDVKSFKIGKCNSDESLLRCTGGCNDYTLGGNCINEGGGTRCDPNDGQVSITIECKDPGSNPKRSSCDGKFIHSLRICDIVHLNLSYDM